MSNLVRRVKTFTSRSGDKKKPTVQKRNLSREKSISMDQMPPIRFDLEKNDLFRKQKAKREQEQKMDRMQRRKSQSYDELRCCKQKSDDFLRDGRVARDRFRTVDVLKDLITDFQCENANNSAENSPKTQHFPTVEEEDVQRRPTRSRYERPKTVGSTLRKPYVEPPIDLKNVKRLEIGNQICLKPLPGESLRINHGRLELLDVKLNIKPLLPIVPLQRKTARSVGKKEVEVIDEANAIYRVVFDTTREARGFVEKLKEGNSTTKNVASWWQLLRLLKKRSSRDLLESKGILKNEPVFGNTIEELCKDRLVPEVVVNLTKMIEEPRNITSTGLYRASANLAVMQNIRCEINAGRFEILERYKDEPDVLAGTLKLFFRELKDPLVTFDVYQELSKAKDDQSQIAKALSSLPSSHYATLSHLMRHLLKVCTYQNENKMDFHNVSICWGPSLITLPPTCLDLVTQTTEFTKITEALLHHFDDNVNEVIRTLTDLIEKSIRLDGLYKKSGSGKNISRIVELIENKKLSEVEKYDVHDICGALKKYVKQKREVLMPDEFFTWFREQGEPGEVYGKLGGLPQKEVIYLLFGHLRKVLENKEWNKLSFEVMANLWITTLLPHSDIQDYKKRIVKYTKLFEVLLYGGGLPDVVTSEGRVKSQYENVPDDDI